MYYLTKYGRISQGKNIQKLDRLSLLTSMFTKTYDDVSCKIFSQRHKTRHKRCGKNNSGPHVCVYVCIEKKTEGLLYA